MMSVAKWAGALVAAFAPSGEAESVRGDVEEMHARRLRRRGRAAAAALTMLEAVDMSAALLRERLRRCGAGAGSGSGRQGSGGRGPRLGISSLDFKLGFRMLARYPGLTVIGSLAIAFAIFVGAGAFEIITQMANPRLPLAGGDRIVGVQNWDASKNQLSAQAVHDFAEWRGELRTMRDLGAFRTLERNLISGDGQPEPIEVAEISASAFRVAAVPPLLGRVLTDADEQLSAEPVAVIGERIWRDRFESAPDIIGRAVRLGGQQVTIVGVMPESFQFPIAQTVWVPLRVNPLQYARGEGPGIRMFGRLADGMTLEEAQAELTAIGQRATAAYPETHEHLRPRVLPYPHSILNLSTLERAALYGINLFIIMLLVLIVSNVALLLFARAATRESELVVRSALGASRGRIITQLVAEALVLGVVGAALGLAVASFGMQTAIAVVESELMNGRRLPFWFSGSISVRTIAYALLLTVLTAGIAGVLPALKVTRGLQARLRETAVGSGVRFGGVWTAIIVAQVAVTVMFPAVTFLMQQDSAEMLAFDVGVQEEQFLTAVLEVDPRTDRGADVTAEQSGDHFTRVWQELERRLEAEPEVIAATFAERLPRMYHPHRLIEVDDGGAQMLIAPWPGYRVSSSNVPIDYFSDMGAPILAGRPFHSGDVDVGNTVVVNQSFVRQIFGERNPVGRRLRYTKFEELDGDELDVEAQPWYEIVGVVPDMGMSLDEAGDPKRAGIYHAARPSDVVPASLAIRTRGDPAEFGPRLRQIAADVDPALRLYDVIRMDRLSDATVQFLKFWVHLSLGLSAVALMLSLSAIYAVTSFTVARRQREIGIRVALGASPRNVLRPILLRPLIQVCSGIMLGGALLALFVATVEGDSNSYQYIGVFVYALLMLGVCMLACVVPTRRALGIQPTEAMRAE